jgi:single-strand DNA-binding protein
MQKNVFVGNLAKSPVMTNTGERAVTRFTLISNEYAGKDEEGAIRERTVSIQFTAFHKTAETIAQNAMVGDQLIVTYRVQNSHYEKDGKEVYGYDFIVLDITLGAPGKAKREHLQSSGKDSKGGTAP